MSSAIALRRAGYGYRIWFVRFHHYDARPQPADRSVFVVNTGARVTYAGPAGDPFHDRVHVVGARRYSRGVREERVCLD